MGKWWKKALGAIYGGAGGPIGSALGLAATKDKGGSNPQLLTNLDKGWGQGWQAVQRGLAGDSPIDQTMSDLVANWTDSHESLKNFLNFSAPMMAAGEAARLRKSPAMKYMEDQNNWDLGAMAGYGTGAGMIGQQTRKQMQSGQQGLAAMGFGRGAVQRNLAQQAAMQAGGMQGDLWSRTYQQAQQNRMGSAQSLLDAHRGLSQMALGQMITPRIEKQDNPSLLEQLGPLAQGAGGLLGMAL